MSDGEGRSGAGRPRWDAGSEARFSHDPGGGSQPRYNRSAFGRAPRPGHHPESAMSLPHEPPVLVLRQADRLREGEAARFRILDHGLAQEAFVVRFRGTPRAYMNVCRHQSLPLDFGDGRFLDDEADALVCVHHGARYAPDTGECVAGPCVGARLTPLGIEQRDGELWCTGRAVRDDAR
jgi:nitrite reductase/ring-hydroxylating ferredoxin subunit